MQMPSYKLTEEVIRQSVEVIFKQDTRWDIAFTNPTAGPWKRIRYGQYIGGTDLRYKKEEDRPDLILFNATAGLVIVLEAKDSIKRLIISTKIGAVKTYPQLEKSVEVFHVEFQRLDTILKNQESALLVFGGRTSPPPVTLLCGYLYPKGGNDFETAQGELHKIHESLTRTKGDTRLIDHIDIVVNQESSSLNLTSYARFSSKKARLCTFLRAALPNDIPLL